MYIQLTQGPCIAINEFFCSFEFRARLQQFAVLGVGAENKIFQLFANYNMHHSTTESSNGDEVFIFSAVFVHLNLFCNFAKNIGISPSFGSISLAFFFLFLTRDTKFF